MDKKKVLIFARSFLAEYFSDINSELIEPIFVTMTHDETLFMMSKGWKVYGCFEDEYKQLPVSEFSGNYLRTSLQSDRFLNRFNHDKRMEILGKEISFWSKIMDETKPDFLVNETVAIEISEVMAIEAQKRRIPFYTYLLGFLPNTFYWKPDPFTGRMGKMNEIEPTEKHRTVASEYLSNVIEKNTRPFYVSNIKKHSLSLKTVVHSWLIYKNSKNKQCKREKSGFKYEDYSIFTKKMLQIHCANVFGKGKYDDVSSIEDKHIVFLPMHIEPEAILNYFVDENYDQAMLITQVLNCIKINQYLVVKEHPQQHGVLLTKKYQEIKKNNPNLIFLPSDVISFQIIKQSEAIVTLTSTVAWEGLILGKPAFVIGKIFYDQCKGVIRIDSFEQLKQELRKDEYCLPNYDTTVDYAAKMISQYHKGCPSPCYERESTISAFTKAIEELI